MALVAVGLQRADADATWKVSGCWDNSRAGWRIAPCIADEYRQVVETPSAGTAGNAQFIIELGDKGAGEHSYTYGKNMWGAMVDLVSGDNVAPLIKDWGSINPVIAYRSPGTVMNNARL